ncbi:sporulation transcriptional regulator SpoIIID [Clostridium sp. HBUAS56017]|uniref:sporulation transcriptional regulator SpoIIID n=1 Tax=Clostridium sp. HBUAS56017 TaxID=2571128 RepID=UPI001177D506|nr:sporulation transcriptional regulator SpoIIID [Clostridium sp. HBUAS56017]
MKDYIVNRIKDEAAYIVDTGSTLRATAKALAVSKSTVHKDLTERLPQLDPVLHKEVRKVLDTNKEERSIRGGIATMIKYSDMKNLA